MVFKKGHKGHKPKELRTYTEAVEEMLGDEKVEKIDLDELQEELNDENITQKTLTEEENQYGDEAKKAEDTKRWKKMMLKKGLIKNVIQCWKDKMSFIAPKTKEKIYQQMIDYIFEKEGYLYPFISSNFAVEFVDTQAQSIADFIGINVKDLGKKDTYDMCEFGEEEENVVTLYCEKYTLPFERHK